MLERDTHSTFPAAGPLSIATWCKWELRRWCAIHDPEFLRKLEAIE